MQQVTKTKTNKNLIPKSSCPLHKPPHFQIFSTSNQIEMNELPKDLSASLSMIDHMSHDLINQVLSWNKTQSF